MKRKNIEILSMYLSILICVFVSIPLFYSTFILSERSDEEQEICNDPRVICDSVMPMIFVIIFILIFVLFLFLFRVFDDRLQSRLSDKNV